jgi:predicted transcriptional regulator
VPDTKNLLLRLDPTLADHLKVVADVEGRTVSDVAREAITELVDRRRRDKRFIKRLEENLDRHRELLDALKDE